MMKTVRVYCNLFGDNFSPSLLEELTGLSLDGKTEVNEICEYRGIPSTYGSASLEYSFTEEEWKNGADELDTMLETLEKNYQALKTAGVEEIKLYLTLDYIAQCNWEITEDQIRRLAALHLRLNISCYCVGDEYTLYEGDYEDVSEES